MSDSGAVINVNDVNAILDTIEEQVKRDDNDYKTFIAAYTTTRNIKVELEKSPVSVLISDALLRCDFTMLDIRSKCDRIPPDEDLSSNVQTNILISEGHAKMISREEYEKHVAENRKNRIQKALKNGKTLRYHDIPSMNGFEVDI
jgi:hypothetical protein